MILDFSKIQSGRIKQPVLRLQTLSGKNFGAIPYVHNLNFDIRYSDVSEISFDVPYMVDDKMNPVYNDINSYKVIYTDDLGIYVVASPEKSGDGIKEIKSIHGYSLEKLFEKKRLYLEEGTYDFWNPAHPADTIIGRILEVDPLWSVGYIDPRLIGCYRLFDEYDSDPLSFCYNNASERYMCTFVFDVYTKRINVYDARELSDGDTRPVNSPTLPIYLSYKNLVDSVKVNELTDDIVTKLHVYGADGFTIRDVNPTGDDYLVDLSYFIQNGDLGDENDEESLAYRVNTWVDEINDKKSRYTELVALRNSMRSQQLVDEVELAELKNELETLTIQQSAAIQAENLGSTGSGLNTINNNITNKRREIDEKNDKITAEKASIGAYDELINAIKSTLSFSGTFDEDQEKRTGFFTAEEKERLTPYIIESEVSEETFVASDVDSSVSVSASKIDSNNSVRVTIESISEEAIVSDGGGLSLDKIYTLAGVKTNETGAKTFIVEYTDATEQNVTRSAKIEATLIRGTIDTKYNAATQGNNATVANREYIISAYLGSITYKAKDANNEWQELKKYPSGVITISGKTTVSPESTSSTSIALGGSNAKIFFTADVTDYQKYAVAQELYDYGTDVLNDIAYPVLEFTLDSGNFLFQKKFAAFKDELQLGCGIYLDLGSDGHRVANIIGIHLDFDDPTNFTLDFSNRFQLRDGVARWLKNDSSVSSASHSFNSSKYIYNRAANKTSQVSKIISGQLEAATNTIIGAKNQSVVIDGAGIHVVGDPKYQIRIVDSMIAMSDDGFNTSKIGIGRFATDSGTVWGVNAEMLAGKAIITENFTMESARDVGEPMMFKLDETGAWLYNSQFILQSNGDGVRRHGGTLIFDPNYGIIGGSHKLVNGVYQPLFTVDGTTVSPMFVDNNGDIEFDEHGMPTGSNFFLDINDGSAYLRGTIFASSGEVGGFTISDGTLKSGTGSNAVVINGDYTAANLQSNSWSQSGSAPAVEDVPSEPEGTGSQSVSQNMYGSYAIWAGGDTPADSRFWVRRDGTMYANGGDLVGCGIKIGDPVNGEYPFQVDKNGNVTIKNGSISWTSVDHSPIDASVSSAQSAAEAAAANIVKLKDGMLTGGSFIDGTTIYSPSIIADTFSIMPSTNQNDSTRGFYLYGRYDNKNYKFLSITYSGVSFPTITFGTENNAQTYWSAENTTFDKTVNFTNTVNFSNATVNFSNTTVTGLNVGGTAVAIFG